MQEQNNMGSLIDGGQLKKTKEDLQEKIQDLQRQINEQQQTIKMQMQNNEKKWVKAKTMSRFTEVYMQS